MKHTLLALFFQTRGSHALPKVQKILNELTDAEAAEMLTLFRNMKDDAASDGARQGARQPWRHGGFGG